MTPAKLPHRQAFSLAWPMIISNISAPLMGMADTAMLGHLDSSLYLGAVAVGANILAFLLWIFAFLRMGTTSVVGRAKGAGDYSRLLVHLGQSLALAVAAGILLLCLQWLLVPLAISLMDPPPQIANLAASYCHIRLFAAPATLTTFVVMGMLIGIHNTRLPLVITLASNALNIALDYMFIVVFDWNSTGAAYATLIAEWSACLLAVAMGYRALVAELGGQFHWPSWHQLVDKGGWQQLVRLNGDLFVRTALLLLVFNFFTAQSAQFGAAELAANAVLIQLVLFQSFGLDGYAHAVEAMGAQALGSRNQHRFLQACKANFSAALVLACVIAAVFWFSRPLLIPLFTSLPEVADAVETYFPWVAVFPLISVWTYILDGIFIGAGKTRLMLITMVFAAIGCFLPVWWLTADAKNNGLWFSFLFLNAVRGASLGWAFYTLTTRHKWF